MAEVHLDDDSVVATPRELQRKEFSRRLTRAMRAKGWRAIDLARASDVGRDAISSYLRGRMLPGHKKLEQLAKAFGLGPRDLLPGFTETLADRDNQPLVLTELGKDEMGEDEAWLKVNQKVKMKLAVQIVGLLKGVTY